MPACQTGFANFLSVEGGGDGRGVLVFLPCYLFATCVVLPLCLDCLPAP